MSGLGAFSKNEGMKGDRSLSPRTGGQAIALLTFSNYRQKITPAWGHLLLRFGVTTISPQ
ncbi:hypothetical protein [Nostoc sp. NMS8]|uniref:hypothetical protein n=1 Tax=Nostoc sp. NMS8 TaxID=2815392 RepID=UPI0025E35C02|nr:hypothetical protein [Nostoc sp. NMS8]MBN3961798.1 hypothetical protein [Nostoc sp. NMS8]